MTSKHDCASWVRSLLVTALLSAVLSGRISGATFYVTTTADSGAGSLRQAILDANATSDVDNVVFQIPGTGVKTIGLLSTLPPISWPVVIDGTTQTGYAGTPVVELNGVFAGENAAFRVFSVGSVIRGFAINRFAAQGVKIDGGISNWIAGNFIGTTTSGTAASANGKEGIWVNGGQRNLIGGTNVTDRNVISGNGTEAGVYIIGGGRNVVQGNIIGANAAGTAAIPNAKHGIVISISYSNLVGGSIPGAGNVVSGNPETAVYITGSTSSGNVVQGNVIGLAANRSTLLRNGGDGVTILAAGGNLIGGTNAAEANVISGNGKTGVHISGASAGNQVCGNLIGTDGTGRVPMGNTLAGVTVAGATGNRIGGLGAGNLISGNQENGVYLSTNANANVLLGNIIGLDSTGTNKLPNLFSGVVIGSAHSNNLGSSETGGGNVISGNAADGVQITAGATNNAVAGNRIGTDQLAARALPNGPAPGGTLGYGVYVLNSSANSIRGNTLSGNIQAGIYLGLEANQNVVQANRIGTDAAGMLSISNYQEGILLRGCSGNRIGGPLAADGNIISGNGTWGISMTNTTGNTIQQNLIGTALDRISPIPNASRRSSGFHSIEMMNRTSGNSITGNVIAHTLSFAGTGYAGVRIRDGATNNAVLGNSFFGNSGLAIDNGGFQTNPNDSCDADSGANFMQNFPVLTQCVTGNGTGVRGSLQSRANTTFRIELFASPACHSSGYGEGQTYLGTLDVTTDNSCEASFAASLTPDVPPGYRVTATATDPNNNTSEFSACATSVAAPVLSAAANDGKLQLAWPQSPSGFVIRQTDNLVPPVVWAPVTNAVSVLNGQFVMSIPMTSSNRFFVLSFE